MAEDNIIRPAFGSKKPEPAKPEPAKPAAPRPGQESLRNFVRASASDAWAGKFRVETPDGKHSERDAEIAGFQTVIGSIHLKELLEKLVQRHEGKIRGYKTLIDGYTDEELHGWLDNPKDSDLQRRPYFFHALIDEANKRFLYAERRQGQEPQGKAYADPAGEVSDDYKDVGPLEGEARVRAGKDLVYMLANQEFANAMRNKIEAAGDTIFRLKDFAPDQESIRLRREGLQSHTLEDICQEIDKTNELQWRRQPSFIGALTLEHEYRVQRALSLMNNEDEAGPE